MHSKPEGATDHIFDKKISIGRNNTDLAILQDLLDLFHLLALCHLEGLRKFENRISKLG